MYTSHISIIDSGALRVFPFALDNENDSARVDDDAVELEEDGTDDDEMYGDDSGEGDEADDEDDADDDNDSLADDEKNTF
jgi:hypothetical protein